MTITQRILARGASALVVGLAALGATTARAADCVGFTDVTDDGPNGFCPSVEWMKNRSVTSGCGATTYCPGNPVSRLAMAAFMKRLGDALTPVKLSIDLRPGAVDLDAGTVVCQTGSLAVNGFPRTAYADGTLGATATADVNFAADVVMSTDGGGSWTALNAANANLGSAPANQWGNLSDLGVTNLDVGQTVRFGLQLSRGGQAGTADLTDSRCQVRVMIYSRTGTTSPL
jgi:hypothetical protein